MPTMMHQFCEATQIHTRGERHAFDILHKHFHKMRLFLYSLRSTLAASEGLTIKIKECTSGTYNLKFDITVIGDHSIDTVRQHLFTALHECDPMLSSQFTFNIEQSASDGLNITINNVAQLEEEANYEG